MNEEEIKGTGLRITDLEKFFDNVYEFVDDARYYWRTQDYERMLMKLRDLRDYLEREL